MFTSYLAFAQSIWKKQISSKSYVIDATCGNGHDTYFILKCGPAHVYVLDIQKKALINTKHRVQNFKNFSLHLTCHSNFQMVNKPINLIVYNLGYLPGGNKSLTTQTETSLLSIDSGLNKLDKRGLISIMVYPGHKEGIREEQAILKYISKLNKKKFKIIHHRWIRDLKAPNLILIEKT